ncbi:MAG: nitrogenase molybdenum-iron protein subunit beta [Helicobacteraceae bacterium]|jgi:nitrogenase molybdenum-iron protein beta chain|nr:nitrogenase molybdenum-iron protein subunit beta [Helicobacteraceae bacterium]
MQNPQKIVNGKELFLQPEYDEVFKNKKAFENMPCADKVSEISEWTKTTEYRELNFKREAITINQAKACQPLGAVMVALGFENTMPYVHGSHGCVAYFRTYFTRHFKEPTPCVSDSMTEDAAVFGGINNMKQGLQNCKALYEPEMIAVSTTCMAEVIGDDLNAFVEGAKTEGYIPEDYPIVYAHTPSFVGSHLTGYDNMLSETLKLLCKNVSKEKYNRLNIVPGFETYLGSIDEERELAEAFGIETVVLPDHSEQWNTGAGEYKMFAGGTPIAQIKEACNASAIATMQPFTTPKTLKICKNKFKQQTFEARPIGLKGTDEFIVFLKEFSGKDVPQTIKRDRARLVDAMQDSYAYIHDKKFAIYGDPDFALGLASFVIELGGEVTHLLCNNAPEGWEAAARAVLDRSPAKENSHAWAGKDLWHLRSLLFTEPVDYLIGNSYGKELERDTKIPLIRIGFPIFDRHHTHRYSVVGYKGGLNLLTWIVNKILDVIDSQTKDIAKTDYFFDLVR